MIYREIGLWDMQTDERLCRNFTWDAIEAIYENIVELGENWEYDPVAICCDYTEADEEDIHNNYDNLEEIREAKNAEQLLEALQYYTSARQLDNGKILYINF